MGKYISITQPGKPDSVYAPDDIAYIKTGRYKGTVLHCSLAIYSDNIDVVQKWNFNGEFKRDTVLVLYEIFSTPKMKLFEVADKDRSVYYFIKKPTDSLPVQMIVRYTIVGYPDPFVRKVAIAPTDFISIAQQRLYIDQLRVIMADCPKIKTEDFEMLDYRSYSFKKIIKRYNKCN